MAIIAPSDTAAAGWAAKIEAHLQEKYKTVFRVDVAGDAGLTDVIKDVRGRGAHRVMALGNDEFVRWAAQAMVGSLMPLAPALLPGSQSVFGHSPLTGGWQATVEHLLIGRFLKVDLAMGTVRPFVHQLLAGAGRGRAVVPTRPVHALFDGPGLDLAIEVDRAHLEGTFWCLVIANADLPADDVRWLPGSDWTDQSLDLLAVRPRPLWKRFQFLRALRRGLHGGQPGVIRFRGHRITIKAVKPWHYSADGGEPIAAADPLVIEARAEQLRLVAPPG